MDNSNPVNTYTRIIPFPGTTTWTTPVLNETTVYTLQSIRNNASPFCETNYPVVTAPTVTIIVVPNGCATLSVAPATGTPPLDLTLCSPGECRDLVANVTSVPSTTSYIVSSIPYCPQAPFENPSWVQLYPLPLGDTRILGDDDWADVFSFPSGMNFCFFGNNYNSLQVGTNGIITFKLHPPEPNGFPTCRYDYTLPIPNTNYSNNADLARDVSNSIMGVYQDTNFAVADLPPAAKNINYQVVGTYPCRKFIVNYKDLPQFQCGNSVGVSTMQIVLYEVSNIIEVYVQRRTACTGWNNGNGTIGIMNADGTQGYAAPGRNAVPFSTDPTPTNSTNTDNVSEAWRFTPTGPSLPVTVNWYEGTFVSPSNLIGTGPTIQVCPTVTTSYTTETVYDVCGVLQTATTTVELNVNTDITNTPSNITQCATGTTATFDLTSNTSRILSGVNPTDYLISYHLTAADAATRSFSITNPSAFVSSGQTIYAAIYSVVFGCSVVKPFELIISSCGAIAPVPDLTICESSFGSGSAVFDLSPQTAIALSAVPNPLDYTITYYLTLANANAGVPGTEISTINAFVGTNQTIYIRMQSIVDPAIFYFTEFNLIVNPLPTIVQPLPPYILNDNGNDGYETFNLSSQNNIILGGQTGMSVTFYPSLANAQNNTNPINNPTSYTNTTIYNQTLGIRVTNSATGCYNISTMDITVLSLGINDTEIVPLQFAPNPVKTNLKLQSTIVLQSVIIYNVLGQKVYEKIINDTSAILDLSNLKTGNYLIKIDAETGQKVIRIVKE